VIKLVLVIPTLDRSGAEKQFTLVATRLPREEFDVHAVALTRGGPYADVLKQHGIPLTVLNKRWKFDLRTLRQLRKILDDLQPDIVHTWLFAANAYGRMVAGNRPKPKVVVSEQCVDTWKSGWQKWLDRRQIGRTTRLIGNSQAVADFYRDLGVPADKIEIVLNGVEIPEPSSVDRDTILKDLDLPAGARVIGYAGRLAKQKRVHDLVWGMQLLRQLTDNVYFLVVGDGPERQNMVELARHMGCDHLMRFLGHREDALELIGIMDVMWLASEFEGMSNSLTEAMAAGVPVVASDIPPNRELVVDGETGFLVKLGDCVGFAQFTDRILANRELARRLGQNGQARAQSLFSIDGMVQSYTNLYRQVLSDGARD
jgi:glycosyltransferase involved in cell wall biosynthesis